MGIFDALNTAVGGLQAQSFALQNISGNIANASTQCLIIDLASNRRLRPLY